MATTHETASTHEEPLRGDLRRREVVDTTALAWTPSPSPSVWRKRLHRVGPAEAGQVTSLVRYESSSRFPEHDHPDGEEILVLEGVYSDHRGDHGPGSWLASPEGHRHAPWSDPGCVIFVKLRQYAGSGRAYVELHTDALAWTPMVEPGVEEKVVYDEPLFPDRTCLQRFAAGAGPGRRHYEGGAELFVIEGELADEHGRYGRYTWLRLPPGASHAPRSATGAVVYVKAGGVASLRSG